jgi:hypothetical protein
MTVMLTTMPNTTNNPLQLPYNKHICHAPGSWPQQQGEERRQHVDVERLKIDQHDAKYHDESLDVPYFCSSNIHCATIEKNELLVPSLIGNNSPAPPAEHKFIPPCSGHSSTSVEDCAADDG